MKPPDACRFLHNKAWFYPPPAEPPPPDAEPEDRATPFWCLLTHEPVGPDGGDVDQDCCGPTRRCYKVNVEL